VSRDIVSTMRILLALVIALAACDRDSQTKHVTPLPSETGSAGIAIDASHASDAVPVLLDAATELPDAPGADEAGMFGSAAAAGPGAGVGSGSTTKVKTKAKSRLGGEGSICKCNTERSQPDCRAVTCRTDLVCGYPCGMRGCNSVCMTLKDAENSKRRP
jgi:hypothetical protein